MLRIARIIFLINLFKFCFTLVDNIKLRYDFHED